MDANTATQTNFTNVSCGTTFFTEGAILYVRPSSLLFVEAL
jgi:hypothetical protein